VPPKPSFIEELSAAARGTVALIMGDRKAPGYFDFSLRGLYGAAIAFLLALTVQTYLPLLLGIPAEPGTVTRSLVVNAVLVGAQVGAAAIVLRQLKRLDAMMPYLVTSGWVTFFTTIALIGLTLFGVDGITLMIGLGIVYLVLEINIARLVMTLSPMQIAMLLVSQLVGVFIGLMLIGLLVPLPPEVAAEAAAAFSQ
jgi:hypothetical protein